MEDFSTVLEFELLRVGDYVISVSTIMLIFLILLITKLVLYGLKRTLFSKRRLRKISAGNSYALFQIVKYVIWVIAIGLVLEALGVKITVLIAGSAALLVGIGLGLQQTFNDIISGIILLSERSIRVDDVLEIDSGVVKIQHIGLRTSKGLNTDDISIIIPNSLITTNKVINWSHQSEKIRFKVEVGTSYDCDIDLVLKILEESAFEHPENIDREATEARLVNFGNSSLDFQVLFFSRNIFRISKVKSDIRRIIYKKFKENNITIPFPQMDLHLRSNDTSEPRV
ncbi:Mechanosensitive ion channel [Flavobacteriaceae bacterium MAR_2010_188]|nr:Mechanosensitive ion channel [Flavobacteriaceae bacterium MAR_2010_188]